MKFLKLAIQDKNKQRHWVWFDHIDLRHVVNIKWHAKEEYPGLWYARASSSNRKLHQYIIPGVEVIDHASGNGLDNRRRNIRSVTWRLNAMNRRIAIRNRTGTNGVSHNKEFRRYMATIYYPVLNGKSLKRNVAFSYGGMSGRTQDEAKQLAVSYRIKQNQITGNLNGIRPKHKPLGSDEIVSDAKLTLQKVGKAHSTGVIGVTDYPQKKQFLARVQGVTRVNKTFGYGKIRSKETAFQMAVAFRNSHKIEHEPKSDLNDGVYEKFTI
jgi:hypothetical protein